MPDWLSDGFRAAGIVGCGFALLLVGCAVLYGRRGVATGYEEMWGLLVLFVALILLAFAYGALP